MAFNPNKRVKSGFNPNRIVVPLDDTGYSPFRTSFGPLGDLAPPPQPAVSTAVDMGEVPRGKMASLLQAKENVGIPLSPKEYEGLLSRGEIKEVPRVGAGSLADMKIKNKSIAETIEDRERFAEYVKSLPQPDIDISLRERPQVAQSTRTVSQPFPSDRQPSTLAPKKGFDPTEFTQPGSFDRRPDEEDLPIDNFGQEALFKKPPPRGFLGAFVRGAGETSLRLLAGPSRNQHLPVHRLLSQLEEYNATQRTNQTFTENVGLGAGGLFPYVAAPANTGLLLFLGELAQNPEQIPEMIKDVPHRVGLIYKAAIKGDQQAIEQLRQEPVETLLALGIPASIALGLGVKSGSIKSALSKPSRGRIAERAGASLRSEISKTGLADAVGLSDARRAQAIDLGKLQEVSPLRQITPPAPMLTGKTTGGRVKPDISKPVSQIKPKPAQPIMPEPTKISKKGAKFREPMKVSDLNRGTLEVIKSEFDKGGLKNAVPIYREEIIGGRATRGNVPITYKWTSTTHPAFKSKYENLKSVSAALDRAIKGKPLTPNQAGFVKQVYKDWTEYHRKVGHLKDEKITADLNLKIGDEVKMDGEWHRVTKKTKDGDIVLKNGKTIKVDDTFGKLPIDETTKGRALIRRDVPIENTSVKREVYHKGDTFAPSEIRKATAEDFGIKPTKKPAKPSARPTIKEAAVSTTHPKTAKAVADGAVSKEPKTIGISNAEVKKFREQFPELRELTRPERVADVKTLSEAKTAGMDRQAISIADDVIRSRRPISRAEEAGIILKQAEIANEIDISTRRIKTLEARGDVKALAIENDRRSAFIDHTDRLTRGSEIGGTELARGLGFRRNLVNRESMELAPVLQRAREATGRKLTAAEEKKFERMSKAVLDAEGAFKKLEAEHVELLAKTERAAAELVVKTEVKARTKVVGKKEKIRADRDASKKWLAEQGFEVKTGLNPEALFHIGRIGVSYIREGAVTLAEVVRKVQSDIPALAEADIYKAMVTRDPKLQAKARSEATKRIVSLKTQAKLMIDIGNAEKGIFESPKPRPQQIPEILALQKKLADLKKEMHESSGAIMDRREAKALETLEHLQGNLRQYVRDIKKKRPVDSKALTDIRNQSRDVRRMMKVEDELLDLRKQQKTGIYKIKDQPVVRKRPPELERAEIVLKRLRQDVRAAIEDGRPWTAKRTGREVMNFLRTVKATADMSYALRQGLVLSSTRPLAATKAFGRAFQATFNKYKAEQIDLAMRSHPFHALREEAGLFLSELENFNINRSEEFFMSRFAEKIPGFGRIVKASERNMVTGLNQLRVSAFDQFVRANPNATMAELTAWADFVNKASGRGKLSPGVGDALATLFFAPKFAVSRIQAPLALLGKGARKHPRVRKAMAKDLAATAGIGITALTLLELSDVADVSVDPRSANFGKARIGNTRIDLWGGFQQPFRLLARGVMKLTDEAGITGQGLTKAEKQVDIRDAAIQFINYKISPGFSIAFELLDKRSVVGEETTRLETLAKSLSPIVVESTIEAFRDAGPGASGLTFGLEFLGMGVNTYQDSDTKVRRMFYRAMVTASPAERIKLRVAFEKTIMKKLDTKGRKQRFKYNKETYNKYVRGDTE